MSFNGPNILEINVSNRYLPDIVAAYNSTDEFISTEVSTFAVNDFPWLEFLEEDKTVVVSESIHAFVSTVETTEWIGKTHVKDPLQFYMDRETRYYDETPSLVGQTRIKLPSTLSFLYNDRPYMKVSDFSSKTEELLTAAREQTASRELTIWVEENTYHQESNTVIDVSLFRSSLPLEPGGVQVSTQMAHFYEESVSELNATIDADGIYLDSDYRGLVTLYVHKRVGEQIALTIFTIISDNPVANFYFGTPVVDQLFTTASTYTKTLTFYTLYSETRNIPLELDSQTIPVSLSIPLYALVNSGSLYFPPGTMSVGGVIIPTGTTTVSLPESSTLAFLGADIDFPMVGDEDIYFSTGVIVS